MWDEKRVVSGPQYTLINDNEYSMNGRPTYMPGADMFTRLLTNWQNNPAGLGIEMPRPCATTGSSIPKRYAYGSRGWYKDPANRAENRKEFLARVSGLVMASRSSAFNSCPRRSSRRCGLGRRNAQAGCAATEDYYGQFNYPKASVLYRRRHWCADHPGKDLGDGPVEGIPRAEVQGLCTAGLVHHTHENAFAFDHRYDTARYRFFSLVRIAHGGVCAEGTAGTTG